MSFNIIHFIVLGVVFVIFILGIIAAFQNEKKKLILPMILTVTLFSLLLGSIGIAVVEKYTKKKSSSLKYKIKDIYHKKKFPILVL